MIGRLLNVRCLIPKEFSPELDPFSEDEKKVICFLADTLCDCGYILPANSAPLPDGHIENCTYVKFIKLIQGLPKR